MALKDRFKRFLKKGKERTAERKARTQEKSRRAREAISSRFKRETSKIKSTIDRGRERTRQQREKTKERSRQQREKIVESGRKYIAGVKERARAGEEKTIQQDIARGYTEQEARRRQDIRREVAKGIATGATLALPFGVAGRVGGAIIKASPKLAKSRAVARTIRGGQVLAGVGYTGVEAVGFARAEDKKLYGAGIAGRALGTGLGLGAGIQAGKGVVKGYGKAKDPFIEKVISTKTERGLGIDTTQAGKNRFLSNIRDVTKVTKKEQFGFDFSKGVRNIKESTKRTTRRFKAETIASKGIYATRLRTPRSGREIGRQVGGYTEKPIITESGKQIGTQDISIGFGKPTRTKRGQRTPFYGTASKSQVIGRTTPKDAQFRAGKFGIEIKGLKSRETISAGEVIGVESLRPPRVFTQQKVPFVSRLTEYSFEKPSSRFAGNVITSGKRTKLKQAEPAKIGGAIAEAVVRTTPKSRPTGTRRKGNGARSLTIDREILAGGKVITGTRTRTKTRTTKQQKFKQATTQIITPVTRFKTPTITRDVVITEPPVTITTPPPPPPPPPTPSFITGPPPVITILPFGFGGAGGGGILPDAKVGKEVGGRFTRSFTAQVLGLKAPKTRKVKRRYTGLELRI